MTTHMRKMLIGSNLMCEQAKVHNDLHGDFLNCSVSTLSFVLIDLGGGRGVFLSGLLEVMVRGGRGR